MKKIILGFLGLIIISNSSAVFATDYQSAEYQQRVQCFAYHAYNKKNPEAWILTQIKENTTIAQKCLSGFQSPPLTTLAKPYISSRSFTRKTISAYVSGIIEGKIPMTWKGYTKHFFKK